jgi:predicted nucleic acid-binding protein
MIRWNDVQTSLEDAERIMADIDPDDSIFLAAAFAVHCDGLWTEDLHFQEQSAIRVWRTKDLLHFMN